MTETLFAAIITAPDDTLSAIAVAAPIPARLFRPLDKND